MTQKRSAVLALPVAALLAIGLLAAPASTRAQGAPSDSALSGFLPTSDYVLVINGSPVPTAEIYRNDRLPAILIITSSLPSPVMLTPRAGKVETINLMKISKQKDGSIDLFSDAVLAPIGQFELAGESPTFTYQGKKVSLNSKPALTGLHKGADLLDSLPEYVRASRAYTPNAAAIATLKKANRPVTVHVVFGSWCPHCRQHVPLMLRVENAVNNPNVKFEYYGIASPPDGWKDPEVKRLGVTGIPTAIVYVNGIQAGRIEGNPWSSPEVALAKIVSGK
jgi:thiol-disulfide isomerase/thioredoxin